MFGFDQIIGQLEVISPLAFLLFHLRMLFLCGENGLFIPNVSERRESRAYLDGQVDSAHDLMASIWCESSILFCIFMDGKELEIFEDSENDVNGIIDNWMMTKNYFKWLIEFFNWIANMNMKVQLIDVRYDRWDLHWLVR